MVSSGSTRAVFKLSLLILTVIPAWAQVSLENFSVRQQSDTAQLTFTFNTSINVPESGPCFLDKLIFIAASTSNRRYQPRFGGNCAPVSMSRTATAMLDIRDYASALAAGVFVGNGASLITVSGTEDSFLPGVYLDPITVQINSLTFTPYSSRPTLESFDFDLTERKLLLHFSDIMSLANLRATFLTLYVPNSNLAYALSSDSRPIGVSANNIKTICITLSESDITGITSQSICINRDRCYVRFDGLLAANYVSLTLSTTMDVQVRNIIPSLATAASQPLYMQLSLSYVDDCTVTRLLTVDEVYFMRRGEYLTRVSCYASMEEGIYPNLTFGESNQVQAIQGQQRTHNSTSLSVSGGFSSDMLGLYSCEIAGGRSIQHYIIPAVTYFIGLPNSSEYNVRLYDSLTIPFIFASYPPTDFTSTTTEVNLRQIDGTPRKEPVYQKPSAFRGEIYFDIVPYSLNANFELEVRVSGSSPIRLRITVIEPVVYSVPSVVAALPTDTEFTLQCSATNPTLQRDLRWIPGPGSSPISSGRTITDQISVGQTLYTCTLTDPEDPSRIAAEVPVAVREIPAIISVYDDGNLVNDTGELEVRNQFSRELLLQCIGHAPSNVLDVMWVSQKTGQRPVELQPGMNNDQLQVSYAYNQANITIVNSVEPYRGILRCQSRRTGQQSTYYFVEESTGQTTAGCPREVDEWGIIWEISRVGFTGSAPCPAVNGSYTGFAYRECGSDGKWGSNIDVTYCSNDEFSSLSSDVENFANNFETMTPQNQLTTAENIIARVKTVISSRNFSFFPQELTQSVNVIEQLTIVLTILYNTQQYTNLDLVETIDILLDTSNRLGWLGLREMNSGGMQLLDSIQGGFTRYVYLVNQADVSYVTGDNLYINVVKVLSGERIISPNDSDSRASEAQISVPTNEIMAAGATGLVSYAIKNIALFFPTPPAGNDSTAIIEAASSLLSSLLYPNWTALVGTSSSQRVQMTFQTTGVLRASNPRCAFWNSTSGNWDVTGVETTSVRSLTVEEMKTFEVECQSYTTRPQAVVVDRPASIQPYQVTTAAYVGSGVILFFASMTIILFLTSCVCGRDLSYYITYYFVYMSFCSSAIATFVVFLVGTYLLPNSQEMANNDTVCTVISVLLHYFFTATFAWILCEAVMLTAFKFASNHVWFFIVLFVLGWGLPVLPVAVSAGLLSDLYTSESFCWFYFDGEITSRIFLSFLVPKLFLFAVTLALLPIGLVTACRIKVQKMEGETNMPIYFVLISWVALLVKLLLLSGSWVFLMLHVNDFTSSAGWIFAGVSIALGLWIMVYGFVSALVHQRVDYESFWAVYEGSRTLKRPKNKSLKHKEDKQDDIPLEDNMFEPSHSKQKDEEQDDYVQMSSAVGEGDDEYVDMTSKDDQLKDEEQGKTYID